MTTGGEDDKATGVTSGEIGSRLIIRTLPLGVRLLLSVLAFPPLLWLAIVVNSWSLHSGRLNIVLLVLPCTRPE